MAELLLPWIIEKDLYPFSNEISNSFWEEPKVQNA